MNNDAISRSAVLEIGNVRQVTEYDEAGYYMTYNAVPVNVIEALPALDVAPVVYCKDCSHARPLNLRELMVFDSGCFVCTSQYGAGTSCPEYEMTGKVVFPKSFCSYAHRRTNGR